MELKNHGRVKLDLLQKSDTRQKINFLADNSSRFQPTNNSIFSPFQRTFAIRQRLESLTVQVFLQEVYCLPRQKTTVMVDMEMLFPHSTPQCFHDC
ncbi:MAG: hypothetical protein KME21_23730 [Desmonostoc vinosum HA7617-LM4]|jgi:hypothetical protein|nr:hypothetical protein [Desmonostoc vinosum HA7617-LM4]